MGNFKLTLVLMLVTASTFTTVKSENLADYYKYQDGKVTLNGNFKQSIQNNQGYKDWVFNTPLPNPNPDGRVISMRGMFKGFSSFKSLDLSKYNTSSVIDMKEMFYGCSSLSNLNLSSFDTSNVTDMDSMFMGCQVLDSLPLPKFNTSKVINMNSMFCQCYKLEYLDVSNFDTSKVTNMNSMFCRCASISKLNLSNFTTPNVTDMSSMFRGCNDLRSLDLTHFTSSTPNVLTSMAYMFADCPQIEYIDLYRMIIPQKGVDITGLLSESGHLFNENGEEVPGRIRLGSEDNATWLETQSSITRQNFSRIIATWLNDPITHVAEISNANVSIFANYGMIHINTHKPINYTIFSLDGKMIKNGIANDDISIEIQPAIYIVKTPLFTQKVLVK